MDGPTKRYAVREPVPTHVDEALAEHPPLIRRLLFYRGITNTDSASQFLKPAFDEGLFDPFLMTDMDKAVKRILKAIASREHIAIYSDYDCDGIPGGVLLHDFFSAIDHANFQNYIPHRHEEGYGFNEHSIKKLANDGVSLIITVDCGITDHRAVEAARAAGIEVIITDHHEPNETLPAALAILNPKRDDAYPFKGLCGSGVAFKLIQALIAKGTGVAGIRNLKTGWEKWWLDVVGLATVADMVPLTGENRVLARYGLTVLRKSRRPGLQQLLRLMRVEQKNLTEDDIGFMIAPRINAASRMDTPEDAFHVLATKDEREAGARARHLEKLNNERKGVVAAMVKEAKKRLTAYTKLPPVIVMGDPSWRPSLVGLVANTLAEHYACATFIWGRDANDIIKGSCRSGSGASVVSLMHEAADAFLEYGGHHASGGFSVSNTRVHTLGASLQKAHQALADRGALTSEEAHIPIDAELTLNEIDDTFVDSLEQLAPFGMENPKPLFMFRNVTPQQVSVFGKGREHTKMHFDTKHGVREAIAFFKTPEQFVKVGAANEAFTLIAHVERSFFMNRPQLRLRIVDIV